MYSGRQEDYISEQKIDITSEFSDTRHTVTPMEPEVFVSYASSDRKRVIAITQQLEHSGVRLWRDQKNILGGEIYGPKIVEAIRNCRGVMLMCSNAAMRSKNVRREIQLAWKFDKPYLPLLLEPVSFGDQVLYWLEGYQWIEVLNRPPEEWAPETLRALVNLGVTCDYAATTAATVIRPVRLPATLEGLRTVAKFTDQIWPVPAERTSRGLVTAELRGLGAPQEDVQHGFRLGSRVRLVIESDCDGHLLLLDEGPEGIIYCLCPSQFATKTRLLTGRNVLPLEQSRYDSFEVTGRPGREQLLAIVTDAPLNLNWMSLDPKMPARVLSPSDIQKLLDKIHALDGRQWTVLSTYFDILP